MKFKREMSWWYFSISVNEVLEPELTGLGNVGKMLASNLNVDTASGQIRTDDQRFTKPLLYP